MHDLQTMSRVGEIADLVRRETFLSNRFSPLQRFGRICRRHGIRITEAESVNGFMFTVRGETTIALNPRLTEKHREFIAFHELGHYFLRHIGEPVGYSELEANLFAFLALQNKETKK